MKTNRQMLNLGDLSNLEKFTFVDIGASGGSDKRWKVLGKRLSVISFEPDEEEFKKLSKNEATENIKHYNCCLAKEALQAKYFVCRQKTGSSCLKPNHEFLERFPSCILNFSKSVFPVSDF